ncbi:DUF302 domain-containing protein [Fluviibacterium sp. DFM31]|uniref:DUF302 domain-containing protein n=1 Tax=Meridianimarinicoccus marinus TaxID=3231483 RepID=A0ABV3L468_9RHOB
MTRLKTLAAAVIGLSATPALAERINITSNADVTTSVDRLVTAVEAAGARVFARVDFAQGAATMGETLRPTTVVIFGSPKIGSTALQEGQTMALYLPLRILFFEDASGQTWATYDDPTAVAPSHGIAADNAAIQRMQAALSRFSAIATGS